MGHYSGCLVLGPGGGVDQDNLFMIGKGYLNDCGIIFRDKVFKIEHLREGSPMVENTLKLKIGQSSKQCKDEQPQQVVPRLCLPSVWGRGKHEPQQEAHVRLVLHGLLTLLSVPAPHQYPT